MPRSNIVIDPYKETSASAKRLALNISTILGQDVQVLKEGESPIEGDFVVGWGSGCRPNWSTENLRGYINTFSSVRNSIDKHASFRNFANGGVKIPDFTVNRAVATEWLNSGSIVLSRVEVNGMKGRGIEINHPGLTDTAKEAPLYTRFIWREREIRLHVFGHKIIYGQEKVLLSNSREVNKLILRDNKDWVFKWLDVEERGKLGKAALVDAIKAVQANGLDFGAVDMLIDKAGVWYVLETNTCPELGRDGATMYAQNIIKAARG